MPSPKRKTATRRKTAAKRKTATAAERVKKHQAQLRKQAAESQKHFIDEARARIAKRTGIKDVMPSSTVRRRFATVCNYVIEARAPVHITRKGEDVVLLAADEYAGMMELLHLLRSPANAQHLIESLEQANRGELVEFDPNE